MSASFLKHYQAVLRHQKEHRDTAKMALMGWALPRLAKLLPLDEESLKEVIEYTDTLPKAAAGEHLKNLLGDGAQALEFITSFNTRRRVTPQEEQLAPSITAAAVTTTNTAPSSRDVSESEVPRAAPRPRKKKQDFNRLPPARRVDDLGNTAGAYVKRDEDDYMAARPGSRARHQEPVLSDTLALQSHPDAIQYPIPASVSMPTITHQTPKLPPSAAGALISDTYPSSRSASPSKASSAKTKVNIAGGTSMRGASTTLQDLDSAIRSLEIQTNPTLAAQHNTATDNARRRCDCMAQRHALLAAAPNCLNCGKIVCAKEGLGPCTFCERPLLSQEDIQAMVRVLKEERGRERQEANNSAHRRAEVALAPRPFSSSASSSRPVSAHGTPPVLTSSAPSSDSESEAQRSLKLAKAHRDRLLKFQADNARRTRIHDEAADFETPDAGLSMWASPQERALQLKRQQKVLREQEWNARPEWERKRVVVSIDVSKGKAVKKMEAVEKPRFEIEEDEEDDEVHELRSETGARGDKGTFARNPLLGSLIRPTYKVSGMEEEKSRGKGAESKPRSRWRRVQDDSNDNEQWILDGGAYGGKTEGRTLGTEEYAYGS